MPHEINDNESIYIMDNYAGVTMWVEFGDGVATLNDKWLVLIFVVVRKKIN